MAMGPKNVSVPVSCIMFLLLCCFVSSDVAKNKQECANQLTSLSACLPFVSGDTKAPTPTCCVNLRKEVSKSKKCLCLLVKDRDDPGLGFKVNATLALSLPPLCQAPNNVTECLDILNLPPNSTDAQVFKQFASNSDGGSSGAVISVTGTPTSSSNTMREGRWLGVGIVGALWHLISVFIIGV